MLTTNHLRKLKHNFEIAKIYITTSLFCEASNMPVATY